MKFANILLGILIFLTQLAVAAPNDILIPSIIPLKQSLTAVEYFSSGRQSGCGLRITGETEYDIWINVLITVFLKDTGDHFGAVKILARKVKTANGKLKFRDGRITFLDIGKIRRAWIKPDSKELPVVYRGAGPSHNDAYMATVEFANTMDLMISISEESFRVGINRAAGKIDEIYQFDQRISPEEAGKLSMCMSNLRNEMVESQHKKTL
ncbi:MAG: hypothetical protein R8M11_07845 [Gallionella sp.]